VKAGAIASGKATLTLETKRSTIRGAITAPTALDAMGTDAAFAAMAKNYAVGSNKIVASQDVDVNDGVATATFDVPKAVDSYVVKAFVHGGGDAAMGHAKFEVH